MKYTIEKNKREKLKKDRGYKSIVELLLFVFSMCAVTMLLIFGTVENKNVEENNEKSAPVFKENEFYDLFDLDLLKNDKITDGVSKFETNFENKFVL